MAQSPVQDVGPAPSPFFVYYRSKAVSRLFREAYFDDPDWRFSPEQSECIRTCLEIPPEYGDPVLALSFCIGGGPGAELYEYELAEYVETSGTGRRKCAGCLTSDDDWRSHPVESALWDAVNWQCVVQGKRPSWPTDKNISVPGILVWAATHFIPLNAKGQDLLRECDKKYPLLRSKSKLIHRLSR